MLRAAILVMALIAPPVVALQLELPQTARQTAARDSALGQVAVPIAPYASEGLEAASFEGPVQRRAYRLASPGLTPLQILAPLRAQVAEAGYEVMLDCDQDSCGGFDFRFAIDVLPAPNMYVNIRDFHFVSARSADGAAAVVLLASAAESAGYLQVVSVGEALPTPNIQAENPEVTAPLTTSFVDRLLRTGAAKMTSIDFAVGTTTLSDAPSPEMADLATLMQERPGLQVAVVGHTDTIGGLDANINVSRARAAAVRTRLIETYGVDPARIEAAGMGYLAPMASNLTTEGREANRRVEVILVRDSSIE